MPESLQSFLALAVGFAVAGALANGYQLFAAKPASFRLLHTGPSPGSIAAVPFLVFAAPFIIMRNILPGRAMAHGQFELAMLATVIAGLWSLMSGTVVILGYTALQQLVA